MKIALNTENPEGLRRLEMSLQWILCNPLPEDSEEEINRIQEQLMVVDRALNGETGLFIDIGKDLDDLEAATEAICNPLPRPPL